jgi:predicted O-methyltransferase YrrM
MPLSMMQWPDEIFPFCKWLEERRPKNGLEIGTGPGGLAEYLATIVSGKLITMDMPNSMFPLEFCQNRNKILCQGNPRITCLLGDSHGPVMINKVGEILVGEGLDLLFIDGDHGYTSVTQDLVNYQKYVNPGGVIAFHDINSDVFAPMGVEVPRFWKDFNPPGKEKLVWSLKAEWGGIGAIVV